MRTRIERIVTAMVLGSLTLAIEGAGSPRFDTPEQGTPSKDPACKERSVRTHCAVAYADSMLIISSDSEAVAFVFGEFESRGVPYSYRHLTKEGGKEQRGEGRVFERYRNQPTSQPLIFKVENVGSELWVKAGSIAIEWSHGSSETGWVYVPKEFSIHIEGRKDFETMDLKSYLP